MSTASPYILQLEDISSPPTVAEGKFVRHCSTQTPLLNQMGNNKMINTNNFVFKTQ